MLGFFQTIISPINQVHLYIPWYRLQNVFFFKQLFHQYCIPWYR